MFFRHKQSLINLFGKLQELHASPYCNIDLCLEIQEVLIKKLTYIEGKINTLKKQSKNHKNSLGGKPIRLSKAESAKIKKAIKNNHFKIDVYQYLQRIYKAVGDGLAFTYINKWDIKPMAFKEPPGAVSGKSGGKFERQLLRGAFRSGGIAILNDLTNCLRYGDITAITEDGFILLEAKTAKSELHLTDRIIRQFQNLGKIDKFISSDQAEGMDERPDVVYRSSLKVNEINHRTELNRLIAEALKDGYAWKKIEDGVFYYIDYDIDYQKKGFVPEAMHAIARSCIAKPKVIYDEDRSGGIGYFPYTLSITNPEALFAFFSGQLLIFVVIDSAKIIDKLAAKGVDVEFVTDSEWALKITYLNKKDDDERYLNASWHIFGRIPFEFLSLDWFLEDFSQRLFTLDEMISEKEISENQLENNGI